MRSPTEDERRLSRVPLLPGMIRGSRVSDASAVMQALIRGRASGQNLAESRWGQSGGELLDAYSAKPAGK